MQVQTSTTRPDAWAGKNVLLAEDDDDFRALVASTLREAGFRVVECAHGLALAEGLVDRLEADERSVDLVVSDVRMPGVTGLSVLEGLSLSDELQNVPVVLMTAFGDPRLHELAMRFGAISLMEKPFEMSALLQVVQGVFDGCRSDPARA